MGAHFYYLTVCVTHTASAGLGMGGGAVKHDANSEIWDSPFKISFRNVAVH